MFTVGEFSRLARVSKRLLRYYDEIDLWKPVHTDKFTSYRYYGAEQMPRLNRILALRDLGLSLDQIRRLLSDRISTDEMRGMLLLKKAEIEQQVQEEIQRIQNIEARLQFLHSAERLWIEYESHLGFWLSHRAGEAQAVAREFLRRYHLS